jgi:hypothetical protein
VVNNTVVKPSEPTKQVVNNTVVKPSEPTKAAQPNAQEIFPQICNKPDLTTGFHFKMTSEEIIENTGQTDPSKPQLKRSIETNGKQQNPDMLYMATVFEGNKIEMFAKGNKIALKNYDKPNWQLKSNPAQSGLIQQLLSPSKYLQDAKFIDESEINGIKCRGIEITLTDEGFAKVAGDNLFMSYKVKQSNASYNIWYDPAKLLPYRIVFSISMTVEPLSAKENKPAQKHNTTVILDLSDYDKDVEIVCPDEVKALFEKNEPGNEPEKIVVPESPPSEPKKGN